MTNSLPSSLNIYGLKCDAPTCDYNNPTIKFEEYENYLNAPCPKCGAPLLTEADYKATLEIIKVVKLAEALGLNNTSEADELYSIKIQLDGKGIPNLEVSKLESEDK